MANKSLSDLMYEGQLADVPALQKMPQALKDVGVGSSGDGRTIPLSGLARVGASMLPVASNIVAADNLGQDYRDIRDNIHRGAPVRDYILPAVSGMYDMFSLVGGEVPFVGAGVAGLKAGSKAALKALLAREAKAGMVAAEHAGGTAARRVMAEAAKKRARMTAKERLVGEKHHLLEGSRELSHHPENVRRIVQEEERDPNIQPVSYSPGMKRGGSVKRFASGGNVSKGKDNFELKRNGDWPKEFGPDPIKPPPRKPKSNIPLPRTQTAARGGLMKVRKKFAAGGLDSENADGSMDADVKDMGSDAIADTRRSEDLRDTAKEIPDFEGTFKQEFAKAKARGDVTFQWHGKRYSTKMAKPKPKDTSTQVGGLSSVKDLNGRRETGLSRAADKAVPKMEPDMTGYGNRGGRGPMSRKFKGWTGDASDEAIAAKKKPVSVGGLSSVKDLKPSRERSEDSYQDDKSSLSRRLDKAMPDFKPKMARGGKVVKMASGGSVSSRADGIAKKGKTNCKYR